jgi:hypothetical protein
MRHDRNRRHLLSALTLAPFVDVWRTSPVTAQSGAGLPPLAQPPEPTKAAFLARARSLRDQAVREGDQAYGAVVVRDGMIMGEDRNYVVLHIDPPPTPNYRRCAMQRAGWGPATCRNVRSTLRQLRARCARVLFIGLVRSMSRSNA